MDKPAKVVVVGTGAMGSVYAALMKDAGHDVWAIDIWPEHVAAIEANGLRVEGKSGDRTIRMPTSEVAADAGDADLVIIATKFDGVTAAAESIQPILRDDTAVLSIQNGLGGPDQAVEVLGADRVTLGVVGGFGASMKGPGHAHHNGMEMVRFGEYQGGVQARTEWIADVWRSSGFSVKTFDDIHKMVWEKLICNCAFSGPSALTGMTLHQMLHDAEGAELSAACASEALEVARAKGIPVEVEDAREYTYNFGMKIPHSRPSLAQDHDAGKRGEIDAINGAIPRVGGPLGVATPVNAAVTQIIKAREAMF